MKSNGESKVIAFAGKGGVGKTTVAGMLVRYLIEETRIGPVLAVDADPNSNFNEILGVRVHTTIGGARESLKKDVPTGMPKDLWMEYKVNEAVIEGNGFDLIVMGRPEGPGCYCAANSMAKKYIDALKGNYPYIIVDNEAGMEHMSRLVTQDIERLFIISDPTPRGLATARRILDLSGELGLNIGSTSLVVNRTREEDTGMIRESAKTGGITIEGFISYDEEIAQGDRRAETIFALDKSSQAFCNAYEIFDKTLGKGHGED